MSELFHSTTTGGSWAPVSHTQIQGNRASQVQFTSSANTLYCINYMNDSPTPCKSTNGGVTWSNLAGDPTFGGAYWISADTSSTARLLVSDYNDVYFSSDGGTTFNSRITLAGPNGCYVAGAFWNGTTIYVATSLGVYTSTNNGASFSAATLPQIASREIVGFTAAYSAPTTRLMAVTASSGSLYPGLLVEGLFYDEASPLQVYSLDVGAASWTAKQTGLASTDRITMLAMSPFNITVCYAAGGQYNTDWPAVYKTSNAGTNWSSVYNTTTNQNIVTGWQGSGGDRGYGYGGGQTGLAIAPTDANRAAICDYGTIHVTTNGGTTWRQAYVSQADENPANVNTPAAKSYHSAGLENTTSWKLCWSDANNVWACFSDIRGIRSTDGGATWSFNYTGHTNNSSYDCIKHPSNGNMYLATGTNHDMYQTTHLTDGTIDAGGGTILFSSNNGAVWNPLHDFSDCVFDLSLDPNATNTMYAAVVNSSTGGIYRTTNLQNGASSTWTKLNNPPRTQGHPYSIQVLNDGTLVATYSGRRAVVSGSTVFTDSSGVFVSTDNGTSWADRADANMHYYVKDLIVDPHDAAQNTWYACVWSGYGGPLTTNNQAGGLYRTTNRGVNWTRINSLTRVSSCTIDPTVTGEMYLSTETEGLWFSQNYTAGSPTFTLVSSDPFRQPERVYFNPFVAGDVWVTSFGNGLRHGTAVATPIQMSAFGID